MQSATTYITIRIDYSFDPSRTDPDSAREQAESKAVEDALSHIHTIENGLRIENISNCGRTV
jgi:hypothetical protein